MHFYHYMQGKEIIPFDMSFFLFIYLFFFFLIKSVSFSLIRLWGNVV